MQKRGQTAVVSVMVAVVILGILVFSLRGVSQLSEKEESAEILNLKTSIQTKILQQSVKLKGSIANAKMHKCANNNKLHVRASSTTTVPTNKSRPHTQGTYNQHNNSYH